MATRIDVTGGRVFEAWSDVQDYVAWYNAESAAKSLPGVGNVQARPDGSVVGTEHGSGQELYLGRLPNPLFEAPASAMLPGLLGWKPELPSSVWWWLAIAAVVGLVVVGTVATAGPRRIVRRYS